MEAPWCSIDVCFSLCFCMSTICKTRQAASRCFLSLGGSFISLGICIENIQCCFGNEKHVLLKQCEANSFETDRKTTSRLTVLMQAHSLVSLLLFVLKMTKNKETQVTLYGDTALSHGCIKEKGCFWMCSVFWWALGGRKKWLCSALPRPSLLPVVQAWSAHLYTPPTLNTKGE